MPVIRSAGRGRRWRPHARSSPRCRSLGADVATILKPATDFSEPEPFERHPGGATTQKEVHGRNAFSQPAANLSFEERADFFVGNGLFKRLWVTAPSSTQAADGLGPLYNARSCQRCHLKDGRGHPPAGPDDSAVSMFLRLSVPPGERGRGAGADRAARERGAGADLWRAAAGPGDPRTPGRGPHGDRLRGAARSTLEGGEVVHLRKPTYGVADLGYGPMHPDVMLSPRVAPADDRPRPARGDPRGADPRARRPRRSRRRRHLGPAEPGLERGARRADARPVRLEGRPADARCSRAAARSPATSASPTRWRRSPGASAARPRLRAAKRRTATARSTRTSRRRTR